MLLPEHFAAGGNEIAHGLVLRPGRLDGARFVGTVEADQLIGVTAVGFDAVVG